MRSMFHGIHVNLFELNVASYCCKNAVTTRYTVGGNMVMNLERILQFSNNVECKSADKEIKC